jgi:hypothetical protein
MRKLFYLPLALFAAGVVSAQTPIPEFRVVDTYPGVTMAEKYAAAMVGCATQTPCLLVLSSTQKISTSENLPTLCTGCTQATFENLIQAILDNLTDHKTAIAAGVGTPGADGKSAYQVAVDDGFVGTVIQWLASLIGAQGATGNNGPPGADGAAGAQGIQGIPGNTGSQGLPGNDGTPGAQGIQGIQGIQGPQGPTGLPFREFTICGVVNACITWTNLVATYVEGANQASRTNIDLSGFTDFRVLTNFSAAAVAGDLQIHCADTTAFSPQTLLYQLDNPAANALVVGAWTTLPAGCKTSGGVFVRAGMLNGNTTEDPAARRIQVQVR